MAPCLVSLGSNLGDRHETFDRAIAALAELAHPGSWRSSSRHETVPVGGPAEQGSFVNAVVSFHSRSEPHELLAALQRIERSFDRERSERWGARTLDLDLLLYGEAVLRTPELRLPHPRMTFRPFVLEPACEIAGDWGHPQFFESLDTLFEILRWGRSSVQLVGDIDGTVERWISSERPQLHVESARNLPTILQTNQLTIDARREPWPLVPWGPRLVLADCPREHWHEEVLAAVECVWPTMP